LTIKIKELRLFISSFKTEGNFEEYIGSVFFEQTNFTEPTPTLNAASALKIVEPVILTWLPIIINLPRLYL